VTSFMYIILKVLVNTVCLFKSRLYLLGYYLFSYLLISRRYRVPTQSVLGLEGQVLGLSLGGQVVGLGLGLEGCGLDSKSDKKNKKLILCKNFQIFIAMATRVVHKKISMTLLNCLISKTDNVFHRMYSCIKMCSRDLIS